MIRDLMQRLKLARQAGVPIALITTSDPHALVERMKAAFNGSVVLLAWDCVRALFGVNKPGEAFVESLVPSGGDPNFPPPAPGSTLVEAIDIVTTKAPDRSILCLYNSHRFMDTPEAMQAISNARDSWKRGGKTLILMQPSSKLPSELTGDVMTFDDPLPTRDEIGEALTREINAAREAFEVAEPDDQQRGAAADALAGLSAFAVEQSAALCLVNNRAIVSSDLWERKRAMIEQVPGLSLDDGKRTLDAMGGIATIRGFLHDVMTGDEPPALIVRIDEIEKAMAGAGTDLSGVSTDQLGVILSAMEDNGWIGSLLVGPPGSGKSELSKALGGTYGRRTLTLDLGAAKGSLVGQSEQQIRGMVKTIVAIAGTSAYFLASCNKLESLPPELKRRFRYGTWYFDLPTAEERAAIWTIQLQRFGLALDAARPVDDGWTGAEIRNACELARRLRRSPADVAPFIVPVAQSDPDSVERLRRAAAGKWNSASYAGSYRLPTPNTNQPTSGPRRYVEQ